MLLQYRRIKNIQVTLHIFETKPSLFREVPGIVIKSSVVSLVELSQLLLCSETRLSYLLKYSDF